MWTQRSNRWWATTKGSWSVKKWLNSPRATRTELTCWTPSTPVSKKERSVSRPSLTSTPKWGDTVSRWPYCSVFSQGMAGHLLCQKEVRWQYTAACEDNTCYWARRVREVTANPNCHCVFATDQTSLTVVSFNRKIRHFVAIKRPHFDNNNQVSRFVTWTWWNATLWRTRVVGIKFWSFRYLKQAKTEPCCLCLQYSCLKAVDHISNTIRSLAIYFLVYSPHDKS